MTTTKDLKETSFKRIKALNALEEIIKEDRLKDMSLRDIAQEMGIKGAQHAKYFLGVLGYKFIKNKGWVKK